MLVQKCKVKSFSAKRSELNLLMEVKRETVIVVTAETEIVAIVETETATIETVVAAPTRKILNAMFAKKLVTGQANVPMVLAKAARREVALFAEVLSIR